MSFRFNRVATTPDTPLSLARPSMTSTCFLPVKKRTSKRLRWKTIESRPSVSKRVLPLFYSLYSSRFLFLPLGLVNQHCTSIVGAGVVVHVPSFFEELRNLESKGMLLPILRDKKDLLRPPPPPSIFVCSLCSRFTWDPIFFFFLPDFCSSYFVATIGQLFSLPYLD